MVVKEDGKFNFHSKLHREFICLVSYITKRYDLMHIHFKIDAKQVSLQRKPDATSICIYMCIIFLTMLIIPDDWCRYKTGRKTGIGDSCRL